MPFWVTEDIDARRDRESIDGIPGTLPIDVTAGFLGASVYWVFEWDGETAIDGLIGTVTAGMMEDDFHAMSVIAMSPELSIEIREFHGLILKGIDAFIEDGGVLDHSLILGIQAIQLFLIDS